MLEHAKILGLLYSRPLRAMGLILDCGSLGWAAVLAIAGTLLLRLPFPSLLVMALILVPAAAVAGAKLEGFISTGVALERDYMPALVCHLMAWTAVCLPLVVIERFPGIQIALLQIVLGVVALVYFLVLSVCAIRTIAGTSFLRAGLAVAIGVVASGLAVWIFTFVGSFAYFLASPWVLYYLYLRFGSEVRSFGGGLGSRQRLRQLLETSTVNPRDADAHYQLGLIYEQRRDFAQARLHFEKAIQIDPSEADAHYRLGRILRSQGDPSAALTQLEAARAIDDKHSSSEVWREIGVAYLDLQDNQKARDVLREYTNRRPFDAEGQYWCGMALSRLGEPQQAREAWEAAVEAVRTAPGHRRRQIRQWGSMASRQLSR